MYDVLHCTVQYTYTGVRYKMKGSSLRLQGIGCQEKGDRGERSREIEVTGVGSWVSCSKPRESGEKEEEEEINMDMGR